MKPNPKMAMVFMPFDEYAIENEYAIKTLRRVCLDSTAYMCAARIPVLEMESEDPGYIAGYFLLKSCAPFWHKRGMRMLQHMDIVTVGVNAYVILDKYTAHKTNLEFKPIPGSAALMLGGPLSISEKPDEHKQ